MAWYFDRNPNEVTPEGGPRGDMAADASLDGSAPDYANDVARIFVSLQNVRGTSPADTTSHTIAARTKGDNGMKSNMQKDAGVRGNRARGDTASSESEGALAEYFSALFNESFCCHQFKLVGSRIFSSGKFQEEQAANARNAGLAFDHSGDSSNSLDSSGSSSDMRRDGSASQLSEGEPWGWFDEIEDAGALGGGMGAAAPSVAKATPPYILTESLSAQRLWRETAGKRPRQPSPERAFFEEQWAKNFSDSEVDYTAPLRDTSAAASAKERPREESRVLYRAASPFGSAVSKSFMCDKCGQITSIMVHIPKFQIVQTGSDVHAEYLIVVGLGTVTLGVWRRFREFKRLADKLASSSRRNQFHNALCSWRCLRERQRWFRCLDRDYLVLKTFLLERFLHDFVFESASPNTVRDFLGVL